MTALPRPQPSRPAPAAGGPREPSGAPGPAQASLETAQARIRDLEAEVRELRQKLDASEGALVHTEKLQALGQLISGVAHELANPLTAMIARAALVQSAKTLEDARRNAEAIEAQGQRATKIVRNLSSFTRRRPPARVPVCLNEVVQAVVDLHGYQLAASQINLAQDLQPDLALVEADAHELEQVLLNLVINAQHAMVSANGRGQLTVRTWQVDGVVRLAVQDDGPGIPEDIVGQIFKPFFSTKGENGTGLGLAIVHDLIARHGGRIWAESAEGAGTTMHVELPRLQAAAPAAAKTGPAAARPPGRGRLLVVDDEPDIGHLVADLVRRRGYDAEYVESAAAALERARTGRFGGVLTDLRMPSMDGAALWETLRREHPRLAARTVFMTGDHAKPETAAAIDATGRPCLTKPFRSDELDEVLAMLERTPD